MSFDAFVCTGRGLPQRPAADLCHFRGSVKTHVLAPSPRHTRKCAPPSHIRALICDQNLYLSSLLSPRLFVRALSVMLLLFARSPPPPLMQAWDGHSTMNWCSNTSRLLFVPAFAPPTPSPMMRSEDRSLLHLTHLRASPQPRLLASSQPCLLTHFTFHHTLEPSHFPPSLTPQQLNSLHLLLSLRFPPPPPHFLTSPLPPLRTSLIIIKNLTFP